MNGYVKIYRDILDDPAINKDAEHLAVFIYLMLTATHKEIPTFFDGKAITLQPGQLVTGRKKIAAVTGVKENKIFRVLKTLENRQLIRQQTTAHGTLISLLCWEQDEESRQQNEQQIDNKSTTNRQQIDTKQERKKERKKEINIYSDNPDVDKAIKEFIAHRKAMRKPMIGRAIELFVKRLGSLSSDPSTQIKLIETAIERGWQTVYPSKDDKPNKFNNIIQHDWNMTAIEEALLSR